MPNSPEAIRAFDALIDKQPQPHRVGREKILEYVSDRSKLITVGLAAPRRPGVALFYVMSEHTFYDPTIKEKSDQWEMIMQLWEDIVWMVGVFPARHREKLERVARRCKLRFANGVPQQWEMAPRVTATGASRRLLAPNATVMFPLPASNVFTLEHGNEQLSIKYEDDQLKMWQARAAEHAKANWWPDVINLG